MQTPGLPAPHSSSTRNTADNFSAEKPSQTREQFGEVMHRALTSGTGVPPVSSSSHGRDARATADHEAIDHPADKKSTALKPKKPLRRVSSDQTIPDDSAPANAPFAGIAAPPTPGTLPPPNQPAGNADQSPDAADSATLLSADVTNTAETDATVGETEVDDPAAKPILADPDAKATQPTLSFEHSPKPPTTAVAGNPATEAADATADPAEPSIPGESGPPLAQIAQPKNSTEFMSAAPADPRGTSAAKQDVTMKKAEKMQKVAGSAEQDLPGITSTGSAELPEGQKLSEKATSHGEKAESSPIELPTRISTSVEPPSATISSTAATPSLDNDTRALESTHDLVALHAMRLNESGTESLHVVVKPGAGIQISLELRHSARGIEVSASLHKGDFDQLSRHWPDLQQRLEARGVRVGTLTTSENYAGPSQQQFHQSKQQSSQQDSLSAGAFAEFALGGSMTEAPGARAARASAYRGWETWA